MELMRLTFSSSQIYFKILGPRVKNRIFYGIIYEKIPYFDLCKDKSVSKLLKTVINEDKDLEFYILSIDYMSLWPGDRL